MRMNGCCVALLAGVCSLALSTGALAAGAIPKNAIVSATPSGQTVTFSIFLPLQNKAKLDALVADQQNSASPNYRKWLTPDQFNAQFGPSPAAMADAIKALQAEGFSAVAVTGRQIQAAGTAAQVAAAFGAPLSNVTANGHTTLLAKTTLTLPTALKATGASIAAFRGAPRMHMHATAPIIPSYSPNNRYSPSGGYWYNDLKQAYDYPSYQSLDGTGVNTAIVISSDVLDSDVAAVFNHENFSKTTGKAPPKPLRVAIDGGAPFDVNSDGSFEASLDVQQVLGGAPGANVTVVNIPDLGDDHITDAYSYIVNAKTAAGKAAYQIVSSSFGECELFYSPAYNDGQDASYILAKDNELFEQGNAEGITFIASSGDSGGLGCPDVNYVANAINGVAPTAPARFIPGVEFPASSPYVTAVGGTNLLTTYATNSLDSSYVSENGNGDPELPYDPYGLGAAVYGGFWGAGGGISAYFTKPNYQSLVNTGSTFRTLPDVGMQVGGCPGGIGVSPCGPNRSYVIIYLGGATYGVIGTSVAAPEFAGAVSLYVQKMGGGVGNLNSLLYQQGALQTAGKGAFYHRNIPGFDGKYTNSTPSTAYNYIVGNGTPQIRSLFGLTSLPAAGAPQTATNP
jgi:subtilase family serine protease